MSSAAQAPTWRPAWAAGAQAHWKTATFGWLACVIVAFAARRRWSAPRPSTRTRPGPASRAGWTGSSNAGFKQPAGESVLIQSRSLRVERSGLQGGGRATSSPASRPSRVVQNVRSPLAAPGQISKDGHSALVKFEIRGDRDKAVDKVEPVLDERRRRAAGQPAALHRRVRRRERRRRGRTAVRQGPREGRPALAADHAADPGGRVRRARGGGHPAAAGADRRVRHLRPDRAAEPPAARGAGGRRDGAADRARRRRRLLDVLFEARARGARRRAQRAARRSRRPPPPRAARCSSPA